MATEPGRPGGHPGLDLVEWIWHGLIVAGRRVVLGVAVAVAVAGALVAPAQVTLVWGPALACVGVAVVWLVAPDARTERGARRAAWAVAVMGLLVAPFGAGLGLLGSAGAVVLVALCVVGALSLVEWALGVPAAAPQQVARRRLASVRRSLPDLPLEALVREWHAAAAGLREGVDPETRTAAAELREALFDELARRDPDLVTRWLRTGDTGPDSGVAGSPA